MVHSSCSIEARRSSRIVLSAVDTTSVSSATMNEATDARTRTHRWVAFAVMVVETPPPPGTDRPITLGRAWCHYLRCTREEEALRGPRSDRAHPQPRTRGRRGGVPRDHGPIPPRAAGSLLPDPRLDAGRRGCAPGDPVGGLART